MSARQQYFITGQRRSGFEGGGKPRPYYIQPKRASLYSVGIISTDTQNRPTANNLGKVNFLRRLIDGDGMGTFTENVVAELVEFPCLFIKD